MMIILFVDVQDVYEVEDVIGKKVGVHHIGL
jgi:hypothetical protein